MLIRQFAWWIQEQVRRFDEGCCVSVINSVYCCRNCSSMENHPQLSGTAVGLRLRSDEASHTVYRVATVSRSKLPDGKTDAHRTASPDK